MKKERILEICKGLLTFLIFYFSSYLQVIPITLFSIDVNNYTAGDLAIVNTFTDLILVLILIILYFKELKKEFKTFKDSWKLSMDTAFKYWFIGLIIMCVSNVLIGIITNLNTSSNEQAVQTLVSSTPYLMLFTAGILAPIAEELTFRKGVSKLFKNKWVYATASGLIFGILHVIGSGNILEYLYIIPYGSLGFFFALTYYDTKSIYPSIIMHAIHNSALILLSIFAY
ncbi:MAG TPA: CPBP family intramembrane metalloprotease [Candidatus Onthousia excrementipullorum]|uniref:CPBP family intramembrane metalloprotease n=1 Tax=Candidatus Onthousia excrementipullorum TaxID=2840884 RepID=A0A9D1DTJ3_9FIRM|nr:CPBP family intramembrane metalloprotease [Candidatus Onthousia excrementipullorum]